MKVSELSDTALDYWTGKALNESVTRRGDSCYVENSSMEMVPYRPSTDWRDGGSLIESNQIFLEPPHSKHVSGGPFSGWHTENDWTATVSARVRTYRELGDEGWVKDQGRVGRGAGATPLIAAMRAIVTSVYGREVPDA